MSLRFRNLVFAALTLPLVSSMAAANAAESTIAHVHPGSTKTNPLAVGIKLFDAKSYGASVSYFKEATKQNPKNGLGHYYLASALVLSGSGADAKAEFATAYNLSPHTAVGEYCRRALNTYDLSEKKLAMVEREKGKVDKAVTVIHEQLEREKSRNGAAADSLSARDTNNAEAEVARITTNTIHSTGVAPYIAPANSKVKRPVESSDSTVAQAEESIRLERLAAKAKSEEYKRRSEIQNKQADEVAASLESQLKSSGVKGGSTLHPEGTGYYVRYYGKAEPGKALPNVHPSVVRIVPVNTVYAPTAGTTHPINRVAPDREPKNKSVKATVLGQ